MTDPAGRTVVLRATVTVDGAPLTARRRVAAGMWDAMTDDHRARLVAGLLRLLGDRVVARLDPEIEMTVSEDPADALAAAVGFEDQDQEYEDGGRAP